MAAEQPISEVDNWVVIDGSGGSRALGHPKGDRHLDKENKMGVSGYYDLQFMKHCQSSIVWLHPCPLTPTEHLHVRCINVRAWLCEKRCPLLWRKDAITTKGGGEE